MPLNVCFGFCESLVPPLKGAVGFSIKYVRVSQCQCLCLSVCLSEWMNEMEKYRFREPAAGCPCVLCAAILRPGHGVPEGRHSAGRPRDPGSHQGLHQARPHGHVGEYWVYRDDDVRPTPRPCGWVLSVQRWWHQARPHGHVGEYWVYSDQTQSSNRRIRTSTRNQLHPL